MITYDDLKPQDKKYYDSLSSPKEKMNFLLHSEDQYNYEKSLQNDQAMVSQKQPAAPSYGTPTSPLDQTDASTLSNLNSGANWTVGQSEKDRLLKNHPEILQSTSSAPSYGYGLGRGQAWQDPSPQNTDNDSSNSSPVNIQNARAQALQVLNAARPTVAGPSRAAPAAPTAPTAHTPSPPPTTGFFSKIFSGQNYQSSGGGSQGNYAAPVIAKGSTDPTDINWGSNDSNADFFRASQALQKMDPNYVANNADDTFAQGGSVDADHPVVQRAISLVRHFLLNG